ncbi:MAG: GDP-mannose 4,6-dehydratase, partial [Halobacteriales archaeon]|nr:GDP-mannose 4,6-dehydratase [Halobacteriales archaeon]
DFVRGMWQMLQQEEPQDYVMGTGETHSVRELARTAFAHVGLDWESFVEVDPGYYRPTEVEHLEADPKLAREELGWEAEVTFEQLIHEMVESDLSELELSLDEARAVVAERFPEEVQLD